MNAFVDSGLGHCLAFAVAMHQVYGIIGEAQLALLLMRSSNYAIINYFIRPYTVLPGLAGCEYSFLVDQQLCCHRLAIMQHQGILLHSYRHYLEAGLAGAAQNCLADSVYICMAATAMLPLIYCRSSRAGNSGSCMEYDLTHCCKLDKSSVAQS